MFSINKKLLLVMFLLSGLLIMETRKASLEKIDITKNNTIESTKKPNSVSKKPASALVHNPQEQMLYCVNREVIFETAKIAANIKQTMKKIEAEIINELRPMAEQFEEMRKSYETKAKTLNREALAAEEEKIMALGQELQMKQMESQDTYKKEEMRLTKNFLQALNNACKEFLLKDENENVLLLPSDNGIYVHVKYDATEKILEIMDANFEKEQKAAVSANTKKQETKKLEVNAKTNNEPNKKKAIAITG